MFTLANNGTCVSTCTIASCKVCSSNIACQTCNLGYTSGSSSFECTPICSISRCLLCADASTCQICADGYTLSSNVCKIKCSVPNCDLCSSLDSCRTCASGYTSVTDSLGKTICKMICPIGQYNNGGTCVACSLTGC